MPLTKRTKKRLAFLVAMVVVLSAAAGGVYLLRERQVDQRAMDALEVGMAAYEQASYEEALDGIGRFLQRHSDKAEAQHYYAYAESRLNVPLPNSQHIAQAIATLGRAVTLDPEHTQATDMLLSLRLRVGQTLEARQLAERVLESDPENETALKSLVLAHQFNGDLDEAIKVAKRYQQLRPGEVGVAQTLVRLMLQSPTHRIELVGDDGLLTRLRAEQRDDPGFQLMIARAYRALEKDDLAAECLAHAVELPYANNRTAIAIASEFMRDPGRGFEAAFAYIQNVIANVDDTQADELHVWLAQQRLFLGQYQRAAELASAIDPGSDHYADALAFQAISASESGDKPRVQAAADELAKLNSDKASAWERVIRAMMLEEPASAAELRPLLVEALEADGDNAYFRYALSRVYRDLGEPELAASYLTPIVRTQPAWWGAALQLSNLYERSNAIGSAYQVIDQTYKLHPGVNAVRLRWAVLKTALLPASDPQAAREALETIDGFRVEVETAIPGSAEALALARARCMGVLDRKQQLKALLAELLAETDNAQVKAVCAEFSRRYDLGMQVQAPPENAEDQLRETIHRADILVANNQTEEAIAKVEQALEASDMSQAQRDRTLLAFLDNHGLPQALPLWEKAIKAAQDNTALLRAAANSTVVLADERLGKLVTDRLKQITGEEGFTWRIAELRHRAMNAKSNTERAQLADELGALIRSGYNKPDARQLLASILVEMGNTRGALNQLTLAVDENPYHAESNLALIRLALREQRYPLAKAALTRLTQIDNIKPAIVAEIARVADTLGQREIANQLRERSEVAPFLRPRENLARLQDALIDQRPDEVDRLTRELLTSADPALLRQLAIILALYNGIDAATPALKALSQNSDADPAILARTHASIKEITGDPKAALDTLASAVEQGLAQDDRELWTQYLRLLLTQPGGLDKAVQALRDNTGSDADRAALDCLTRALEHQDQRRGILTSLGLEALQAQTPGVFQQAAKLIDQDPWRSGTGQNDGQTAGQRPDAGRPGPSDNVLDQLDALRQANPDAISLYNLLTTLYITNGRFAKAITLAQSTREKFPEDSVSARLLTQAYAETQQWRLVLGAAKTWRGLATPTRSTLESIDLLTATALIETGDPDTARSTLRGYQSDRAVAITARSMIRSGKIADAEEILFPLLRTDSARWRVTAMQLAVSDVLEADPQRAGDWLNEIRPIIPADAVGEKLLWAQTSFVVGQRLDDQPRQQQAFSMVNSMTEQDDFPPSGWLLIGVYHDGNDEDQQAEKAYEKALELDPNQHQAANNLANILMERGELDRAREMVNRAIQLTEQDPRASYIDTLAQIEKRAGNTDKALELFAQAVQLDPENPMWYIDQAELLVRLERRDDARALIRRMKRWVPDLDETDPQLAERFNKLEQALAQ